MGQPIVHFEIIGADHKRSHAFYRDVFGWKIGDPTGPQMGFYGLVDGESSGLAGGIGEGDPRTTIYVQVPDLQATLDKATSRGAKVLMPPTEIPGVDVTLAMFSDPDGNVMGLLKG